MGRGVLAAGTHLDVADPAVNGQPPGSDGRPPEVPPPGDEDEPGRNGSSAQRSGAGAVIVRVSDVAAERVEWLWDGRLPRRKVAVLDGDPGLGKSTLTLDLAARITTGSPMPTTGERHAPAAVVLLSAEDGVGDTIRPRLEAAGADVSRVVVVDHILGADGTERPPSIPDDLPHVERVAMGEGAVLVVVDPLMAFLGAAVNAHRDQDVRRALHALAAFAERTGAAVIVVRHLNKSGGGQSLYRGGGSIGIIGAARAGLLVAEDPDDSERRIVAVSKSNLGPMPEALAYRLVPDPERAAARIKWEGATQHTANDLLTVEDDDRTERDDAVEWLRMELASGERPARDMKREAEEAGFTTSTVKRAKRRAGVRSVKRGEPGTKGQKWVWVLRDEEGHVTPEEDEGGQAPGHAPLRPLRGGHAPLRGAPAEGAS